MYILFSLTVEVLAWCIQCRTGSKCQIKTAHGACIPQLEPDCNGEHFLYLCVLSLSSLLASGLFHLSCQFVRLTFVYFFLIGA